MSCRAACVGCSNALLDLVTLPSLAKRWECKDEWLLGGPGSKVAHKPFFMQGEPDHVHVSQSVLRDEGRMVLTASIQVHTQYPS